MPIHVPGNKIDSSSPCHLMICLWIRKNQGTPLLLRTCDLRKKIDEISTDNQVRIGESSDKEKKHQSQFRKQKVNKCPTNFLPTAETEVRYQELSGCCVGFLILYPGGSYRLLNSISMLGWLVVAHWPCLWLHRSSWTAHSSVPSIDHLCRANGDRPAPRLGNCYVTLKNRVWGLEVWGSSISDNFSFCYFHLQRMHSYRLCAGKFWFLYNIDKCCFSWRSVFMNFSNSILVSAISISSKLPPSTRSWFLFEISNTFANKKTEACQLHFRKLCNPMNLMPQHPSTSLERMGVRQHAFFMSRMASKSDVRAPRCSEILYGTHGRIWDQTDSAKT